MAVLLAANASFIPASPLHIVNPELSAVRWGIEELNERSAQFGYGGIELHWSNVFKHCRDLRNASSEEAQTLGRGIVSVHESWRGVANPVPVDVERTPLRPASERQGLVIRIGSALLFPTGAASLDHLERLERKLHRSEAMHYVMFPDPYGNATADQAKTARFVNSSIQPTIDVGASWGARTMNNFVEELTLRGYKATIDSFHISREGKVVQGKMNWAALATGLLQEKLVREVHVSVARNDFENVDSVRYKQSVNEAKALVDNGDLAQTPLGQLAELLRQHQWTGNVVIEATIPGLGATFGKITPNLLAELHQSMTAGVRQLLPHITWENRFQQARQATQA